jgi:hypothetical protein
MKGLREPWEVGASIAVAAAGCSKLERFENDRDMCGEGGSFGGFVDGLGPNRDGEPGIVGLSNVSLRGDAVGNSNSNVFCTGDLGACG